MKQEKQTQKKRHWWKIPVILLAIMVAMFLYCYISSLFLVVETYTVEANITNPIRVVHLTDLHNREFGKENQTLIQKVAAQHPNVIFMTGDMLDRDDARTDVVTHLISELVEIAPVYYCYGNHEYDWEAKWGKSVREICSAAGATVLDIEYKDVEINGNVVRIGGYMGYWSQPHMFRRTEAQKAQEYQFFSDFRHKDLPNGEETCRLVLNHIPTGWLDWHYIDSYDTGIVFSGHYHGGMIRIPFIDQGVIAPYVGWWPPYTKGVFVGEKSTCILSTGLGIEHHIPRLNNPPEIVVVDLAPE